MNTALSKAIFGIGVALSIASIISIYVTMVAKQNQPSQGSSQVSSSVTNQPSNKTNTGSTTTTTTTITIPQGAAAQQVKVYYLPNPAQLSVGSKITWINKDTAPHTATAINGSFDTSLINAGSSGSAIIKGTGTIQYHCTIHPWMTGILQTTS
jgi:plastocyanin